MVESELAQHGCQEGYCVNWQVMFYIMSQVRCVLNFSTLAMVTLWTLQWFLQFFCDSRCFSFRDFAVIVGKYILCALVIILLWPLEVFWCHLTHDDILFYGTTLAFEW